MTGKHSLRFGIAATAIFWIALVVFAAIYPDYTHSHKAISELGAFAAPNALAWNLIGFIIPGLLLALCGAGIALRVDGRKTALFWLLVISGLGFAGTGIIPAEMANGSPRMESPWTTGHVLMTFVSGLPWLVASVLLVSHVRRDAQWQHLGRLCQILSVCAIASLSLNIVAGAVPFLADNPGLVQRIAFAVYFGWFVVVASMLAFQDKSA